DRRRRGGGRHEDLPEVEHADQIPGRVRIVLATAPLVVAGADACFEEQPAGHRRGPTRRRDTFGVDLAVAGVFGRGGKWGSRRAAEGGRARAFAADRLLVPNERELVSLRRLPRDARRVVFPR